MDEHLKQLALSTTFTISDGQFSNGPEEQFAHTTSAKPALQNSVGLVIDSKYRILSLLGEGGMGAVFRAHHLSLNKDVALKTFRSASVPPDALDRFEREVRAVAKLEHQNVVRVFDFGIAENNQPYYTMELLDGQSLADKLAQSGPLPIATALAILKDVANGLSRAHAKGIVHRDLKPANIFLLLSKNQIKETKIVDFGIAKLVDDTSADAQKLTKTGMIFGSPLYMSPEQSLGEATDERTDIYSCGCTLYEMLTGRPPFVGNNAFETITLHNTGTIPALVPNDINLEFPLWLDRLVARMLAKDKEKRIASFAEVLSVIESNTRQNTKTSTAVTVPIAEAHTERDPQHSRASYVKGFSAAIAIIFICAAAGITLLRPNQNNPGSKKVPAAAVVIAGKTARTSSGPDDRQKQSFDGGTFSTLLEKVERHELTDEQFRASINGDTFNTQRAIISAADMKKNFRPGSQNSRSI